MDHSMDLVPMRIVLELAREENVRPEDIVARIRREGGNVRRPTTVEAKHLALVTPFSSSEIYLAASRPGES